MGKWRGLSLLFPLALAFAFFPSIYGVGDNDKSDKKKKSLKRKKRYVLSKASCRSMPTTVCFAKIV